MLLNRNDNLVRPPAAWSKRSSGAPATVTPEASPAVALDPRVGSNLRLGDDPSALPSNMRAQAEPHIARSQVDPDFLTATFQEGRFATNGGAVDCGYAITHDGGLSWSRALIQNLTMASGGVYFRATDPVAAIDLSGNVYLSTFCATDANFTNGRMVVSKSTNGGQSFGAPVIVYSPPNNNIMPDKNWIAINTFPATSTVGRIVVTWTQFTGGNSPIMRSYSDNGGANWSSIAAVNPSTIDSQGSQPVFLPNGNLVIVYWNDAAPTGLEAVISTDGGVTFGAPKRITNVTAYLEPSIRSGWILPCAIGNRTNSGIYVVYQALLGGNPRIAFTKSTDGGSTWSSPIAISDNPANSGVFNAAISASPDGQTLTAIFYDHRNNPGSDTLVDLYLAQSFDGGGTWQPNIRLTPVSTDASLAPLTSEGYMLGDYQAVAETTNVNVPAVPVWVDTRTGNPDPFIARVGIAPQLDFTSWQAARLSLGQINDPILGGPTGNADFDDKANLVEYAMGTSPLSPSAGEVMINSVSPNFSITYPKLKGVTDVSLHAYRSINLRPNSWANGIVTETMLTDDGTIEMWEASTPANSPEMFFRLQATQ